MTGNGVQPTPKYFCKDFPQKKNASDFDEIRKQKGKQTDFVLPSSFASMNSQKQKASIWQSTLVLIIIIFIISSIVLPNQQAQATQPQQTNAYKRDKKKNHPNAQNFPSLHNPGVYMGSKPALTTNFQNCFFFAFFKRLQCAAYVV